MSKIINIRGCNGSGKTTLVRGLLDYVNEAVFVAGIPAYKVQFRQPADTMAILGSYENTCGGMDTVKTQLAARTAVEEAAAAYHATVFEGILISTIYGPWAEVAQRLMDTGHEYVWAFLDTPLDVCLERIYARNGGKPINEQLVRDKHRTIERVMNKADAAGMTVAVLPWQDAANKLQDLLD